MQAERAQRYALRFRVDFLADGRIVRGWCENISASGLLATFEEELDVWTNGELRLHGWGQRSCRVPARVARTVDRQAGLSFRHSGETEGYVKLFLDELIEEMREAGETVEPPF